MRPVICAIVCSLVLGQVEAARAETVSDAIAAANSRFTAAFNAGDSSAVAALYTPDAMVLPPDEAKAEGRDAIRQFWKGAIDAGVKDLTLKSLDIGGAGGLAYEVGNATMSLPKAGGGMEPIAVKYVVVWRQASDGQWQLYRDIWNAEPPAAH